MSRVLLALVAAPLLTAQTDFQQQGFVEFRGFGFPQTASNDRGRFIGEAIIRYDVLYGLGPGLTLNGGTETRMDTHRQTERQFKLNWDDRGIKRPNFSIRSFSLKYTRGPVTLEAGKQTIRWGRTITLSPTDRFAPRDFLFVVDHDVLSVSAARAKIETRSDSFEVVLQPFFTPSRIPLLNQRWTMLPQADRDVPLNDLGSRLPGGPQWGARWEHSGDRYEMSTSYFEGYNHLPLMERAINADTTDFRRLFPKMRMFGADMELPLNSVTLKGEAGYFLSPTKQTDDYILYVVQADKPAGSWLLSGGYTGESVLAKRSTFLFAPDRGLARSFFGRAIYTINANRTLTTESVIRQNGKGLWARSEYSERWGQHWTGKIGVTLLRGTPEDFLGQYRRNSFFNLSLRYSF